MNNTQRNSMQNMRLLELEHLELSGLELYLVVSRTMDLELRDSILVRSAINCIVWNNLYNLCESQFPHVK